jgi:hypothetical protein
MQKTLESVMNIGEEFALGLFSLSVAGGLVWFALAVVLHA